MARRVTFHGDIADIEEVELIRSVPIDLFFAQVENRPAQNFGPLPLTARFIRWDESNQRERHLFVMTELPPGIRNLRFLNRRYNLSIPWTYFLYDFWTREDPTTFRGIWSQNRVKVFWAEEQATNWDSPLARALIANCDTNGVICYGDTGVDVTLPINARIDRLTTDFYLTTFMHDSGTGVPFQSEGAQTWARWEMETAQHGATAFRNFPEWRTEYMPTRTVQEHFNFYARHEGTGEQITETPVMPMVQGGIPDLPTAFTFQRAEEWLRQDGITAVDRHRLFVALQNQEAENPGFIEAPVEPDDNDINTRMGGQPLAEGDRPI